MYLTITFSSSAAWGSCFASNMFIVLMRAENLYLFVFGNGWVGPLM